MKKSKQITLTTAGKKYTFYYDNKPHAADVAGIHGTWTKDGEKHFEIVNMNTRMKLYRHYLKLKESKEKWK